MLCYKELINLNYILKNMSTLINRTCQMCERGSLKGHRVSHSNIKTIHRQEINLQTKTVNGKKIKICTKCIRTLKKNAK